MLGLNKLLDEKKIHLVFDVTLWLKGAFAFSEILAGLAAYFVPQEFLIDLVYWVTTDEFGETKHDLVSNFLLQGVEHLSVGAKTFAAIYLLAHGVVKLWLIVGLLRQKLWYYPISLIVFALFIVYQLYRYSYTQSIWLLFITAVDVVVIVLTWHEYRFLQRSLPQMRS